MQSIISADENTRRRLMDFLVLQRRPRMKSREYTDKISSWNNRAIVFYNTEQNLSTIKKRVAVSLESCAFAFEISFDSRRQTTSISFSRLHGTQRTHEGINALSIGLISHAVEKHPGRETAAPLNETITLIDEIFCLASSVDKLADGEN